MNITEVKIRMVKNGTERLCAFCSVTLDDVFVVRDLKIIDGANGPFVAMPSRKLGDRCPKCGCKNHLRARFCNDCGQKLNENRGPRDTFGRVKLHTDVAHPINSACRDQIQKAVLDAYTENLNLSDEPEESFSANEDEPVNETADDMIVIEGDGPQDSKSDYDQFIEELRHNVKSNRKESERRPIEHDTQEEVLMADPDEPMDTSEPQQEPRKEKAQPSTPPPPPADDSFGAGIF